MKNFLVTLVLALAVAGMAMPQTVGVGVGPTFGESVSAAENLYRKAVLRYTFNDPTGRRAHRERTWTTSECR
jgi:hypothetical protein